MNNSEHGLLQDVIDKVTSDKRVELKTAKRY